jgi:hypothetical protein
LFSISALKEIKVGHLLTIGNVYWWGLDGQSYDHLYQEDNCQSFGF